MHKFVGDLWDVIIVVFQSIQKLIPVIRVESYDVYLYSYYVHTYLISRNDDPYTFPPTIC